MMGYNMVSLLLRKCLHWTRYDVCPASADLDHSLQPVPSLALGTGWSVSLTHSLDRQKREDAKQDEDRRSDVQERITMRQCKDEASHDRYHGEGRRVGDIAGAHVVGPVL